MSDAPHTEIGPQPWWRHGWVWFLLAIPGSAVAVGILMLTLAINGPTALVRDDYYKAGLAINEQLDGDRLARQLGVEARLGQRHAEEWWLEVSAARDTGTDGDLTALLQHPTLAERDLELTLVQVAPQRWAVSLPRISGRRVLDVHAPEGRWRLRREIDFDAVDIRSRP